MVYDLVPSREDEIVSKWMSEGNWMYEISANGTECAIRGYKGKGENIVVPEQCGGYTVTTFGNDLSCVFIFGSIQTVILPKTVSRITSCAFLSCVTLKEISLPADLLFIGDNAFYGCSSLKSIALPVNISRIKYRSFCGCESLNSLIIPPNVKEIESMAFLGCCNLSQVDFCEGLEIIGNYVFKLTNISKVVLPNSIKSVNSDSFDDKVLIKSR